jgi:hypothetical protein
LGVIGEGHRGQVFLFDFQQREIEGGRDTDDARVSRRAVIAQAQAGADLGIAGGGGREDDAHALRTFHYVGVGDDVAVGIHDYAGAQAALAADRAGVGVIFIVERAVAGDLDLDDGGRDAGGEFLQRFVELHEEVFASCFGWGLRFLWSGRGLRGEGNGAESGGCGNCEAEQCARAAQIKIASRSYVHANYSLLSSLYMGRYQSALIAP